MRAHQIIVAALAATVVACSENDVAGPGDTNAYRSPVGTFTLATVNGSSVPMLWDEMQLWSGGPTLRAYWNGGSIQFRADSTYTVVYRHSLTGPNLPGNVLQDTYTGTWRLAPGAQIELRPSGGGVQLWQTTDLIYSLTRTSSAPNLDGGEDEVIFVFVRD
jgi:hypothetical protein